MNELLFIFSMLTNFAGVLLAYRFFGKAGIYSWIALATIIANIEVLKCIDLFGMPLTLGNVTFGSIFLATDILNEKFGQAEAKKGVYIGFFALLIFVLFMQIDLLYVSNAEDFAGKPMKVLFSLTPRICLGSMIAYFISNMIDVYLYSFIRNKFPSDKFLWIRNNGATMTAQIIDTVIFTCIAFVGIFSHKTVLLLCITTYIIKLIISLCDTPFLYIAKKIRPEDNGLN